MKGPLCLLIFDECVVVLSPRPAKSHYVSTPCSPLREGVCPHALPSGSPYSFSSSPSHSVTAADWARKGP